MEGNASEVVIDAKIAPKVTATYVTVTDDEVKADFRYSLTDAQQKNDNGRYVTCLENSALKMRIQLEKAFGTTVTKNGGQGRLYNVYFAGSTMYNRKIKGFITYARAFVNRLERQQGCFG